MASPIDNITGMNMMQPVRRTQGSAGKKDSGSQQGLQEAVANSDSTVKIEKVDKISTKFSAELEKSLNQSGNDNESLESSLQQVIDGFQSLASVQRDVGSVSLDFQIDEKTGEIVVQLVDKETEEVIRQVPPEEMRQLMSRLRDNISNSGLFLDMEA
jgi:flagellar protein FlaG